MVRHTDEADDEPNTTTTTTATVYHAHFEDPDAPGERYEVGADLGMGYDFAVDERGIDVAEVFDEAYEFAGTVEAKAENHPESVEGTERLAGAAYTAWERGAGHDPTETRSMAVGDIIVVDGDAYFVDRVGFEKVDIPVGGDE